MKLFKMFSSSLTFQISSKIRSSKTEALKEISQPDQIMKTNQVPQKCFKCVRSGLGRIENDDLKPILFHLKLTNFVQKSFILEKKESSVIRDTLLADVITFNEATPG